MLSIACCEPEARARVIALAVAASMSSAAGGGYGAGAGSGAEPHCHGDFLLHHHAQHVAAQQLYHVPQHSRREKLRFPPDESPPHASASGPQQQQQQHHHHHQHAGAGWPPAPPGFYSYATSSTSSYSPHSPTLAVQAPQLVAPPHAHGLAAQLSSQIPTQNFALSLSSSSSNPPPPQARRTLAAAPSGPFGPFTGYAAVLGRSRFLAPAEKLLEEICDVGGAAARVDRSASDEGLLDADPMEGIDHDMDGADRAACDAGPISGAEQQWKKTRLISMMEEVRAPAPVTLIACFAGFASVPLSWFSVARYPSSMLHASLIHLVPELQLSLLLGVEKNLAYRGHITTAVVACF